MPPFDPDRTTGADLPPGLHAIGGYRLLRLLGKGGMSEVFLGYDQRAGQPVAIKLMSAQLALDPLQLERFERETILSRRLNHPHIVRGLASGRDPATKRRYLILEYIDGLSAQAMLDRRNHLEVGDVAHIALGIARALEHLHDRQFIHRDIKPDNILLSPCGRAKLIDLGLARWEDRGGEPLTATSDGFGTSYYMPPEQALNAHFVDARSDIFALGATLYHLLTGRVPFPGEDHYEVTRMKRAGHYTPASLLNPRVPAALEAILKKMLECEPTQRYANCAELLAALRRARLAVGLPSYADLGQALRETKPAAKPQGDATRPDMRLRMSNLKRSRGADCWIVRYQNRKQEWQVRKATTEQLLNALKVGRFAGTVFGARRPRHKFRPLADFPEFHTHFATEPKPAAPAKVCFYRRVLSRFGLRLF